MEHQTAPGTGTPPFPFKLQTGFAFVFKVLIGVRLQITHCTRRRFRRDWLPNSPSTGVWQTGSGVRASAVRFGRLGGVTGVVWNGAGNAGAGARAAARAWGRLGGEGATGTALVAGGATRCFVARSVGAVGVGAARFGAARFGGAEGSSRTALQARGGCWRRGGKTRSALTLG